MQTLITWYLLIGLFNAMLGMKNYFEEFFPEAVVSCLFYLFLWPLQLLYKIAVWLHAGTGWLLGRIGA